MRRRWRQLGIRNEELGNWREIKITIMMMQMRPFIGPINRFKLSIRIRIEMADILPVRHRTQTGGMSALLSPLSELCTLNSFPSFTPTALNSKAQCRVATLG